MNAAIRQLATTAIRAPSADNSQPWQLEWDGHQLLIGHRQTGQVDPFGPAGHPVLLSVGHLVEASCEYLRAARGEFDLSWSEYPEHGSPYAVIRIGSFGNSTPEALPALSRHTNRFPFSDAALPAQSLGQLASDREATARIVMLDEAQGRHALADVVNVCSQARFRTRELHEWLMASLRVSAAEAATGDGLDFDTLNLPPGGRTFMRLTSDWRTMRMLNRLGLYKILASADSSLLYKAPLLMAVVGHGRPAEVMAAGRLIQRTWVALNGIGLAVQPYYAVTDQYMRMQTGRVPEGFRPEVADALARLPALLQLAPDEMLHLILRIGWPTRQPKRSLRLPLDSLFRDLTKP